MSKPVPQRLSRSLPARRSKRFLLPSALAVAGVLAGAAAAHADKTVTHFVLANGMQVVVVPDRRVPIVTHMVWYKVGAADEPEGQSGAAHFLEHMMFRGSEKFPDGYIKRYVMVNGGVQNAHTTADMTWYYQRLPKQKLSALMELEADRMINLRMREEEVRAERGAVMEELRGNENNLSYLLGVRIRAALYPGHPYGRPVIGFEPEIGKLTQAHMLAFYRRFYGPDNAILVVAGDVTEGEVRTLAEQTYGRVPARSNPAPRPTYKLPDRPQESRVVFTHERATAPGIARIFPMPAIDAVPRTDAVALDVLAHIAGGNLTGRLYRRLVIQDRLATGVSAAYSQSVY
ncbi:MAG: M16 family metallopeptidase, partial [Hyphomicrobiaceae bacterium]